MFLKIIKKEKTTIENYNKSNENQQIKKDEKSADKEESTDKEELIDVPPMLPLEGDKYY